MRNRKNEEQEKWRTCGENFKKITVQIITGQLFKGVITMLID